MATMSASLIARYQPGGDIYNRLAGERSTHDADFVATAARSGDSFQVTEALATLRSGPPQGNTSTLGNFVSQLATDPLAAPLESLDNQVSKIFDSSGVKTILTVAVVVVVVVIIYKTA